MSDTEYWICGKCGHEVPTWVTFNFCGVCGSEAHVFTRKVPGQHYPEKDPKCLEWSLTYEPSYYVDCGQPDTDAYGRPNVLPEYLQSPSTALQQKSLPQASSVEAGSFGLQKLTVDEVVPPKQERVSRWINEVQSPATSQGASIKEEFKEEVNDQVKAKAKVKEEEEEEKKPYVWQTIQFKPGSVTGQPKLDFSSFFGPKKKSKAKKVVKDHDIEPPLERLPPSVEFLAAQKASETPSANPQPRKESAKASPAAAGKGKVVRAPVPAMAASKVSVDQPLAKISACKGLAKACPGFREKRWIIGAPIPAMAGYANFEGRDLGSEQVLEGPKLEEGVEAGRWERSKRNDAVNAPSLIRRTPSPVFAKGRPSAQDARNRRSRHHEGNQNFNGNRGFGQYGGTAENRHRTDKRRRRRERDLAYGQPVNQEDLAYGRAYGATKVVALEIVDRMVEATRLMNLVLPEIGIMSCPLLWRRGVVGISNHRTIHTIRSSKSRRRR